MAIISVRVSADIPIQSEYLPLISLYFFLGLFFTFISFNWFVAINSFRTNKSVPSILKNISKKIICLLNRFKLLSNSEFENNDETENSINTLNFLFFSLIFLSMFISYISIWLVIAY
jgi:hypothetical protein